jgi:hypothetical protein
MLIHPGAPATPFTVVETAAQEMRGNWTCWGWSTAG